MCDITNARALCEVVAREYLTYENFVNKLKDQRIIY